MAPSTFGDVVQTEHLDENLVQALVAGRATAPEVAQVEVHIATCADCLELVTLASARPACRRGCAIDDREHVGDCDPRPEGMRARALHALLDAGADENTTAAGMAAGARAAWDRCPSCLLGDFEVLVDVCKHCGAFGCDLCIFDGDAMYNPPNCCGPAVLEDEQRWNQIHLDLALRAMSRSSKAGAS